MPTTTPTRIHIPTPLRRYAGGEASAQAEGQTAGEALADLAAQHPELKSHLYNEEGTLRSFVNVYKNDEDIRYLSGPDTPLNAGDELSIIPSVAGGI